MESGQLSACSARQVSERQFYFSDTQSADYLSVIIPEVIDPAYGMYVWPCAPVLAQYIWMQRQLMKDKHVLELGAGTSLPGVVAAKCGARVILSDSAKYSACLENCRRSLRANNIQDTTVIGLTWGQFTPDLLELGHLDVILGSDCFYDKKDFEDIIVTVSFIMERNPHCEFWCTYQERSSDWSVAHLLEKWGLICTRVQLSSFHADRPEIAGSNLPGNHTIRMLVFRRKDNSASADSS